jgi:hypothetical protein
MAITQVEMADHPPLAQSGRGLEALGDEPAVRDVHLADAQVDEIIRFSLRVPKAAAR